MDDLFIPENFNEFINQLDKIEIADDKMINEAFNEYRVRDLKKEIEQMYILLNSMITSPQAKKLNISSHYLLVLNTMYNNYEREIIYRIMRYVIFTIDYITKSAMWILTMI